MVNEFPIELDIYPFLRAFLYSQFFVTPTYPTQSFTGQTVIVTGSNVGLGLEAARHFYRLNCAHLILAVRSISKGEAAKEDIVQSVPHRNDPSSIAIWSLDLSSTKSTIAFTERLEKELPRVDVLVECAGLSQTAFEVSEGYQQTIQVNVLNTLLLAILALPRLEATKINHENSNPHLVVVTSEAHKLTKFPQINAEDIYKALNDEKTYNGQKWYEISKLLEVLFIRELVARTSTQSRGVTINLVNPGLCKTMLSRDVKGFGARLTIDILFAILGRSVEVGSRTLVLGACAGEASHGMYMSNGINDNVATWIDEDVGKKAQRKVWTQTMKILESRKSGLNEGI